MGRTWVNDAVRKLNQDRCRSADTHLIPLSIPGLPDIDIYLKDESTHVTGSLKHRLARSLFLHAICSGLIEEGTPVIEASSGSTAISEAYFARMLGLPFYAVMPTCTSHSKVEAIEFYDGKCHFVETASEIYDTAQNLADETGGYYIDQFENAAKATDWRGNNNIAESIFKQMESERFPEPRWIVVGAGTGGTSATIGRYVRYHGADTQVCVVDPDRSVFYDYYYGNETATPSNCDEKTHVEGIGRPRVEPSFLKDVIDRMIKVPNCASYASARFLAEIVGRRYGGSTGTNLYGVLMLAAEMKANGESGSIVTLACDSGERYTDTYYSEDWLADCGVHMEPYRKQLDAVYESGTWPPLEDV